MKTKSIYQTSIKSILILLFSVLTAELNAQHQFGIISGINISNQVSNVDGWKHSSKITPALGLLFALEINKNSSIVLEMVYTGRGSLVADIRHDDLVYNFQQKYLELPVLFRYSTGKVVKPFVQAGPCLGILIDSKLGGHYLKEPLSADTRIISASIDLGLCFGAGVEYKLGFVNINLQANYNLGLLNTLQAGTIKIQVGETTSQGTISALDVSKSRALQLMLGLSVPISSK